MARPNNSRMRRIKRALAVRDGAQCFYCALPFPTLLAATVDHLIPQSLLPGWAQINLVLACRPCNQRKSGQLPQVFLRTAGLVPSLRHPAPRPATVRARTRPGLPSRTRVRPARACPMPRPRTGVTR
ncbi:HNH endonuclease [Micromonospora zingiberis]|uniref:HNH endonuclease n=1 Tax=Micromonospora zingiberis TaxID=2053011 RepID=A0A4R0G7W9_9ACTN|nr:HNH endonuclease signature motif containing protein [Micromonospora zingiberis]TCB92062.1 HNH endonuclease [Micromonospora zingiberis]